MDQFGEQHKTKTYNHIAKYTNSNWISSIYNLLITLVPMCYLFMVCNFWIIIPLVLFLIRLFIIFHDMCHNSYFPNTTANRLCANILGIFLITPASYWTEKHGDHHRDSNKLDIAHPSQSAPWTISQYHESTVTEQKLYKFAYGQYTLYTIIPLFYFVIVQHIGAYFYETLLHILYILFLLSTLNITNMIYVGVAYWLSGVVGFILFHSQHTFDGVYKEESAKWDYFENGIKGSSFLQLPKFLKFFALGIEYHHIHHLNAKVPSYKLQQCHDESGDLFESVEKITIWQVLKSLRYSIYNDKEKTFESVYSE